MKVFNKSGVSYPDIDENKELARGGEGRILDISPTEVAKIYHPGITVLKEDKFNELSNLRSNQFVKPEKLLFDKSGKVVGFTMNKISSEYFPLISTFNKSFCARHNISFDVRKLIIERVIESVKFAHSVGVVIGDLNPYNILVNDSASVYFIDVDSYQTTHSKHSGVLLEDVRDFLYNGEVSVKADCFSLSVLSFNALTFVHPFKGVHKKHPNIVDRMIHKESVLKTDPNLIIPKCYEPINDKSIVDQFERIFNNGERFVIQLSSVVNVVSKPLTISVTKSDQLIMHKLHDGKVRISASSKEMLAFLDYDGLLTTFDLSLKGTFKKISQNKIDDSLKAKLFVHERKVILIKNNTLYLDNKVIMNFGERVKAEFYENILVVVTSSTMFKFKLNELYGDILPYDKVSVFGGRFSNIDGLFQNVSGSTVIFYESKNALNSSILSFSIKNLVQSENFSIIEKIENEKIIYKFISIKNLKTEVFDYPFTELRYFDCLNSGTIVVPEDDKLILFRTEDMNPVVEFNCSEVSSSSVIHCTNAGIVIVNEDNIYLVNKK